MQCNICLKEFVKGYSDGDIYVCDECYKREELIGGDETEDIENV